MGEIENLPFKGSSVDVVVTNYVINLPPDNGRVLREARRVLKHEGRIMTSDLAIEGELPDNLKKSFEAWATCIAGATEKSRYLQTIQKPGFENIKIVFESTYDIDIYDELKSMIASVRIGAHKA